MEKKTFLGIGFALTLSAFGAWYFYNKNNEESIDMARYKSTCSYLDARSLQLSRFEIDKKEELNNLKILFGCTVVNKEGFTKKHAEVCNDFLNYVEKFPKIRFIIKKLLNDIYKNVCTFKIENNKNDQFLKDLKEKFEKFGFTVKYDDVKILKTETTTKQICEQGLDLVLSNKNDLKNLIEYVYLSKDRLKKNGYLEIVIAKFQARIEKHKTSPEILIEKDLGWGETTAKSRAIFNICNWDFAIEKINESRGDIQGVVFELLELLSSDNSETGKKMKEIISRIVIELSK